MEENKKIRVRVTLVVDVDADEWTMDYGVEGPRNIQNDVRAYIRNAVDQGPAGFENMELAD